MRVLRDDLPKHFRSSLFEDFDGLEDLTVDRPHVAIGRDPSAWPLAAKPNQHFAHVVERRIFCRARFIAAGDFVKGLVFGEVGASRFQPPRTRAACAAALHRRSLSLLSFSERATTMPPMQSPAIAIAVSSGGCVLFF